MMRNQRGQSLVQAIVAIGIMSIAMVAMADMLSNYQRELRALSEKLAVQDMANTVTAAMVGGTVCKRVLNPPSGPLTFNAAAVAAGNAQSINVQALYASYDPVSDTLGPVIAEVGQPAPGGGGNLVVARIRLVIDNAPSPFPPPGPNISFKGTWLVEFESDSMVRSVRSPQVSTILTVDTTVPGAARVTGCQNDLGSGVGGAAALGFEVVHGTCNNPAQSVPNAFVIPSPEEGICSAVCPAGKVAIAGGGMVGAGYVSLSTRGHRTFVNGGWASSDKGWVAAGAGPVSGPWSCGGGNSCRVVIHAWAFCVNP